MAEIEKIERNSPAERLWAELEDTSRNQRPQKPMQLTYHEQQAVAGIMDALFGDSK
jgi:hypothetical protein